MDWIIYIVLGLVQGITEWLPISSSGHLVLIQDLFNINLDGGLAFEVLLNFATFLAMIIVFRKDLMTLIMGFFGFLFKRREEQKQDFFFGLYLIIGTIPAAVLGLLFGDMIEEKLNSTITVSIALIITGLGLYVISKIEGFRRDLTIKDALWVGIFQAIALIPGISRSGSTLFAALYRKLDKEVAIRYSFFLAIPVSIGTMLLKLDDLFQAVSTTLLLQYTLAFVVSLTSAIFAIKWFIGILNRGKLIYFTYYCIILGSSLLIYTFIF